MFDFHLLNIIAIVVCHTVQYTIHYWLIDNNIKTIKKFGIKLWSYRVVQIYDTRYLLIIEPIKFLSLRYFSIISL